jgi:predicted MFS family arabinose efflux permease
MKAIAPVRLVGLSSFCSMASMRMCDPMLPGLGQEFAVTTGEAAHVIAAYTISYGVLQLFYGPLGDRVGPLRVIWLATLASAVLSLMTAGAPSLDALVWARAAMGAAAAGIIPLSVAWVGDHVPNAQRQEALARLMGATVFGMMVGQWFGGFVTQHWGWRFAFVGLGVLFGLAVWRMHSKLKTLPRFVPPEEPVSLLNYWQSTLRLLTESRVQWVLGATLAQGALVLGTLAFFPIRLVAHFGFSLSEAGGVMVLYGVAGLIYSQLARQSVALLGQKGLAWWGGGLIAGGMGLLALADWPVLAVLGCTLSGLGFYMMHNTLQMQATQMAPQAQSMAITLFACTLFFGQTVGVSLMARLLDANGLAEALLVAAAGIVVLCMVIARGVQSQEKLNPP